MKTPKPHHIFIVTALLLLYQCGSPEPQSQQNSNKEKKFREYLKKFPIANLPFHFDMKETMELTASQQLSFENAPDSIFYPGIFGHSIAMMSDTTEQFTLIYLEESDSYTAFVSVYDKHGNNLENKELISLCRPVSECMDCMQTIDIRSDRSIAVMDSLIFWQCDTTTHEFSEIIDSVYVQNKVGKISSNGKVLLKEKSQWK